jgi:pimeloyl-ACP methyl ester carboxylesterase
MALSSVNGTGLYYEDGGSGPPAVFIPGGFPCLAMRLEDFEAWTWTWEADLARHFHFVWYDRRGCWRSQSPSHGYELENQAQDLASLLDHLYIGSAQLAPRISSVARPEAQLLSPLPPFGRNGHARCS